MVLPFIQVRLNLPTPGIVGYIMIAALEYILYIHKYGMYNSSEHTHTHHRHGDTHPSLTTHAYTITSLMFSMQNSPPPPPPPAE
jgi:hypothetical protein